MAKLIDDACKNGKDIKIGDICDVCIGKRVINNELSDDYEIPVYSANVFEPFGKLNRYLITDFSKPSILFGLDGDWQVRYIKSNEKFYPTDHCGYIRAKNDLLYLNCITKSILEAGLKMQFDRNNRPNVERIKNLKIRIPQFETQKELSSQIEKVEEENEKIKDKLQKLKEIKNKKLKNI